MIGEVSQLSLTTGCGKLQLMNIHHHETKQELGKHVADIAAEALRSAIKERQEATIVVATGASQFEVLEHLVDQPGIDWSKVTAFHMDEYVGLSDAHPASFCRYLRERFTEQLPTQLKTMHFINGEAPDPTEECRRLNRLIAAESVDVLLGGIGENAHLAFNDPPADFVNTDGYHVVNLDEDCRQQQVGEGWFGSLEEVPKQAISMTIQETLRADLVLIACPDARKAKALQASIEGPVTETVPASILQQHSSAHIFLDPGSASALSK